MGRKPASVPEIGEGKRGVEGRLGYLLRQAQATQRQAMEKALAEFSVTPPQFVVLTLLNAYPGISGADAARLAYLTPQTVSLIVRNLERAGAVARRAHDVHGRIQHLDVTADGAALLARCKKKVAAVEARLSAGLTAQQEQVLRAWLVRVAQDASAATPGRTLPSSHSRKAPPAVET